MAIVFTPDLLITMTGEELTKAYELWNARFLENPSGFCSNEELVPEAQAAYLVELIQEVRS